MRRAAVILSFVAAAVLPVRLLAHEGHAHKIMGTVTQVHAEAVTHIEVKTTDGRTVVITVNDKTRYTKGQAAATLKDVQAGSRIVATVTMQGETTTASEIKIGERGAPAAEHR